MVKGNAPKGSKLSWTESSSIPVSKIKPVGRPVLKRTNAIYTDRPEKKYKKLRACLNAVIAAIRFSKKTLNVIATVTQLKSGDAMKTLTNKDIERVKDGKHLISKAKMARVGVESNKYTLQTAFAGKKYLWQIELFSDNSTTEFKGDIPLNCWDDIQAQIKAQVDAQAQAQAQAQAHVNL